MKFSSIRLDSGLSVKVESFSAYQPMMDTIEGSPETVLRLLMAELRGKGSFLYEPPPATFPAFLMTTMLVRKETASSGNRLSWLKVSWFDGELPRDLHSAIAWHARGIDWDKHAEFVANSPDLTD